MSQYYKYSRTYHLPWSLGTTSDDKILHDISHFDGMEIAILEKMDGENCNMYCDRIHARSLDSKDHASRHWVKGLWGRIQNEIPEGWRICGENLYAKHSVYYDNLSSYFQVFSIWDENNDCLSWAETKDICNMLELELVPVIGIMQYDERYLRNLANSLDTSVKEGYVIRNVSSFKYEDFGKNVAKWVRANHVTTSQHWMYDALIPNKMKNNE